jgi:peroxiredoxin
MSRTLLFRPARRTLILGATLMFAGVASIQSQPASAAAAVGQPAPDFSVTDTQGTPRNLSSLKGKIVVLEWTNADCPFTKKHYDSSNMQNLQREAASAGVVWLSVVSSAPGEQGYVTSSEANKLTTSRKAAPAGVLLDPEGKLGHAYGAMTTPHMFVIDAQGVLRYAGGIDSLGTTSASDIPKAVPYFHNALLSVEKGQAVAQPITRPYGCSVKYSS